MEISGFSFSLFELVLVALLSMAFFHQLYYYFRYINLVSRINKKEQKGKRVFVTEYPPVSIIICAKDEAENLRNFLPAILNQDYPEFEVVVINDGSTDETTDLLKEFRENYPNLRTTFVPVSANIISTKKLGITLGVKAATHEWLLFTDADCVPKDKHWIAKMARNFTPETEFVLGYGAYFNRKGFINRLITYDTLFIALQYLGMAASNKPYMGVGRNMAYRKQTFLDQKGFASTLHLKSGDDDLMVNKAANSKNTRVEISPESITWSEPNTSFKGWFFQKERHLSVASFYTSISKFRLSLEPISRGLFYLMVLLLFVFGNLVTLGAATLFLIIRFVIQLVIVNNAAKHFGEKKFYLSLILFDIYLPLVTLYIFTIGRMTSREKSVKWK
jgi:cellulose synthase/poly-beta-1,6-N-acetylglucosamine synthase-like glycosyltransferase